MLIFDSWLLELFLLVYVLLGVIMAIHEIRNFRPGIEWWQALLIIFAALVLGGACVVFSLLVKLPYAAGYIGGYLVRRFLAGWRDGGYAGYNAD